MLSRKEVLGLYGLRHCSNKSGVVSDGINFALFLLRGSVVDSHREQGCKMNLSELWTGGKWNEERAIPSKLSAAITSCCDIPPVSDVFSFLG